MIIAGDTGLYIQSLLEGYHLGGEHHEDTLVWMFLTNDELAHLVSK